MTYDLVLFDCDGTLVDSEYLNLLAIFDLLKECGIHQYDMNHGMLHFSGHRFSHIIRMISRDTGFSFPDDSGKRYLQKVRDLAPLHMKPVQHVDNMVNTAQSVAKTYVVSNGERQNVLMSLDFVGLRDRFPDHHVISGAMSPNPKPAPDLFLMACKQENILPQNTLAIEDSVAGVMAACAGGIEAWGFCGTHHAPVEHAQKLRDAGASHVFSSMSDMCAYFSRQTQHDII